jgi:hypothetical protein
MNFILTLGKPLPGFVGEFGQRHSHTTTLVSTQVIMQLRCMYILA